MRGRRDRNPYKLATRKTEAVESFDVDVLFNGHSMIGV